MKNTVKIEKYVSAISVLLEAASLDKIRIKDICDTCGTDRQNFYYYFEDKYDLASWIFRLDFNEMYEKCEDSGEKLVFLLERMWAKRKIYTEILNDNSQNSLLSYVFKQRNSLINSVYEDSCEDSLAEKNDLADLFYFHGSMARIKSWLSGEFEMSAEKLAGLLQELHSVKVMI